ncbi:polyketide-8 synthase acyl carrier protein [Streptomyces sp. CB09001]|uniref:acyl carrier protein n=1 Tax=unclassified Streptomyces TaxID=2593676 RepID=UPI000E20E8DB|nr:acyl carrier protein [Streptomyces sp. CB09001]AXL91905.1 polyketide-8 synthase acyl carrier protein [Streptomyces sp. CB09001]
MTTPENTVADREARKAKIKEMVCRILEIDPEQLTDTSRFKEEHDADSLRAIEILAGLEREFGITIEQEELSRMVNLDGVESVVDQALPAR